MAENQCTIADNTASKTVLKRGRGEKDKGVSGREDHSEDESSGEHLTSEPQTVALHSSSGGNWMSVMTGTQPHISIHCKCIQSCNAKSGI